MEKLGLPRRRLKRLKKVGKGHRSSDEVKEVSRIWRFLDVVREGFWKLE
jgi:hypothetical protein